jgi:hypothetical protein
MSNYRDDLIKALDDQLGIDINNEMKNNPDLRKTFNDLVKMGPEAHIDIQKSVKLLATMHADDLGISPEQRAELDAKGGKLQTGAIENESYKQNYLGNPADNQYEADKEAKNNPDTPASTTPNPFSTKPKPK